MAKSATRRLKNLNQYTDNFPINPLIEMREDYAERHGATKQLDFAVYLGVNKSVVASAEEAMFQLIPSAYRNKIIDIKTVNRQYQSHRRAKRVFNFTIADFPTTPSPSRPMESLLEHFDLVPWAFGAKSCVHHVDIWKMTTDATQATQNFIEFLQQIGLLDHYPKWLAQFNAALRSDNPTNLKLNKPIGVQ